MIKIEEIKTIKKSADYKFKEKSSLFLSKSFCISNEGDAEESLNKLRKENFDATHHCYAYRLTRKPIDNLKYSDDGEPSGTAGIRILNAIDHFGLTNTLVVVIRYFGGTKLGVGPLGKAYYNSAFSVLELSETEILKPYRQITLTCTFPQLNTVHRVIASYGAKILDTFYEEEVKFVCTAEANKAENIKDDLIEASQNQIRVLINDNITYE
jgi:uncharacterized YigZ family protein